MKDFRLGTIPSSSILHVYSLRSSIWFDPPYQRMSDIWPLDKRQLLIDSIINGFDIPKLYFHEFYPAREVDGVKYKYAIVDGKQRLESIFSFIEGKFALDSEIELIDDPGVRPGSLTYAELATQYPDLKTRFDGFVLPIISILTEDTELIEDMFSRLNEAVPLNAAEKRNALGGPLPAVIRDTCRNTFFSHKLPFTNRRFRHYDLATKFLYITHKQALVDTKKIYLDDFVKSFRSPEVNDVIEEVKEKTLAVLSAFGSTFVDGDALLRSVGSVTLYYYLFFEAQANGWLDQLARSDFLRFEELRRKNREDAERELIAPVYHLLEYDRLTQTPNDAVALRYRYSVLRHYIGPAEGRPQIPSDE